MVHIIYRNAEIGRMTESGTKTLLTGGMYCDSNIDIDYVADGASVTGGAVYWNQLAALDAYEWTTSRAKLSFIGTTIVLTTTSSSGAKYAQFPLTKNHKYLVTGTLHAASSGTFAIGVYSGTTANTYSYRLLCDANGTLAVSFIVENAYDAGNLRIQHATGVTSGSTGSVDNLQVFDLTAMFGATVTGYIETLESASAGAGIALFNTLFAPQYQRYNHGANMTIGMW